MNRVSRTGPGLDLFWIDSAINKIKKLIKAIIETEIMKELCKAQHFPKYAPIMYEIKTNSAFQVKLMHPENKGPKNATDDRFSESYEKLRQLIHQGKIKACRVC